MAELRGLLAGAISVAVGTAAAALVLIWVSVVRGDAYSRVGWRTDLMESWRWSEITAGMFVIAIAFVLSMLLNIMVY